MKNITRNVAKLGFAVFAALSITQGQQALAGWSGLMNGAGIGWASVNVTSSTHQSNRVTTLNISSPSAAITSNSLYKANGVLPPGAATNTYARIKGLPGGIWQAALNSANSADGTDNAELESKVAITPADCASITFESVINQTQSDLDSNGFTGTISVNATATAGTALWLRGFEYTNSMADVPPDDPTTVENESIEYIEAHGVLRFESLMVGPFEFGGVSNNTCPLIVPFTLSSGNLSNIVFATDAVAKSYPLAVVCPDNIYVYCGTQVVYQPVNYYACGDVTVTYNPPAGTSFPVGTTPVTVTISDTNGNSTNCTFTVTVLDTTPPVAPVLPVLTNQCSVQVPAPTTTDDCAGTVTGTTTDPTNYTAQGTYTVHWSFSDGNGNTSMANQIVIVKDTIPPVVPVLPVLTNQCSVQVPAPTTTDNCAGIVLGTTTDPTNYYNQGTYTVHWSFSDGNGNTSMANQTVIVKDTIPPVPPVLTSCSGTLCAPVTLTAPTATDNCAGPVKGTTTTMFPITKCGTTVVTWTFKDGNGNTSTATQTVTLKGLDFDGFYSPIGGTGGSYYSPQLVNVKCGSVVPVKFESKCGGDHYRSPSPSIPTLSIECYSSPTSHKPVTGGGNFRRVSSPEDDWHFDWDTSRLSPGVYQLIATLQDGSTQTVFVKLK
jgi:hypothetical protein